MKSFSLNQDTVSPGSADRQVVDPPAPGEHLASPATQATLRIQNRALAAARALLHEEGFVELMQPMIGPFTDPGVRGSKQVDVDYYGHRYKLMTSGIFYKQASLVAFEKIFYIAPNVRLEPPHTRATTRHLAEFNQLDVEVRDASRDDVMALAERLVVTAVETVCDEAPDDLAVLGRDAESLRGAVTRRFKRVTHDDAVRELQGLGYPQSPDAEIEWAGEELLSERVTEPFFVVDYPRGCRGFYDREVEPGAGVLNNFDMLAPEGYGEMASGGEREFEYAAIVERIRETGENPGKYGWYLDLARQGLPASAGFGIGVERLTRFLGGLDEIWQASAFPKLPGIAAP